jgi:hypothetical protein
MKVALKKEIEAQVLCLKGRLCGFNKDIELLNAVFEDLGGDIWAFLKKGAPNQGPFYKPPSSST